MCVRACVPACSRRTRSSHRVTFMSKLRHAVQIFGSLFYQRLLHSSKQFFTILFLIDIIYTHIRVYIHTYIYIYTYIKEREREREREREGEKGKKREKIRTCVKVDYSETHIHITQTEFIETENRYMHTLFLGDGISV